MRIASVVILFVCLCGEYVESAKKLPGYITPCKRNDPEVSKCWEYTLEKLQPYFRKGIPEFNIPPVEPLRVESLTLNQGDSTNINFLAHLDNLTFAGGTNFDVFNVDVAKDLLTVKASFNFPSLIMEGHYKAKGRVLLFQFDGDGKAEGAFENVTIHGVWHLEEAKRKDKTYFHVIKDTIDSEIGKIHLQLHNLIMGNPDITKVINDAINENIDILYSDFKPLLSTTIGTIILEYTSRVYDNYPIDVLYV